MKHSLLGILFIVNIGVILSGCGNHFHATLKANPGLQIRNKSNEVVSIPEGHYPTKISLNWEKDSGKLDKVVVDVKLKSNNHQVLDLEVPGGVDLPIGGGEFFFHNYDINQTFDLHGRVAIHDGESFSPYSYYVECQIPGTYKKVTGHHIKTTTTANFYFLEPVAFPVEPRVFGELPFEVGKGSREVIDSETECR